MPAPMLRYDQPHSEEWHEQASQGGESGQPAATRSPSTSPPFGSALTDIACMRGPLSRVRSAKDRKGAIMKLIHLLCNLISLTSSGLLLMLLPLFALAQAPQINSIAPRSGLTLGGTHVTISGFHFDSLASVTIGCSPLENVAVLGDTKIAGNVPAGLTGPADVTVATSSGNDTLSGGFTYVAGRPAARNALRFDGADDMVEVPDHPALSIMGDFTVEAWVRLPPSQDTATYTSPIVCKASNNFTTTGNYWLNIQNDDNHLVFAIGDGIGGYQVLVGSTNLGVDRWMHVAAVRSESSLSVYVNGLLENATPRNVAQRPNDAPLRIGGVPSMHGSLLFLEGVVDEVRVWNTARTVQELQDAMHRSVHSSERGLVGYWTLNGRRDEQTVPDSSATSNNGVLGTSSNVEGSDPTWVTSDAPIRSKRTPTRHLSATVSDE
ncbi:hypothetical protein DF3PB_2730003 [uncultured Defluviicoccus sp.]|uniref:LamG-like jellyroll fold domain-containing protein n=1 Tax=metagenome TaxID=256318 RepID=A0A380TCZ5_9ZZZZ|nr:hypothetical protein DF3PB_2730003 [uncultured Defluviicoccus sp.]